MPAALIPNKPMRDLDPLELTASNKFGPGVSLVNGQWNPAGRRSGVVTVCTTISDLNTALATCSAGTDIVGTAGVPFVANQGAGTQVLLEHVPAAVPGVTMPPPPMMTWSALTGLVPAAPPAMASVSAMGAIQAMGSIDVAGPQAYVRLMSSAWASLPDGLTMATAHVRPSDIANLLLIQGGGFDDIITVGQTGTQVKYYRFEGVLTQGGNNITGFNQHFDCGRISIAPAVRPHHIILDRCWLRGSPNGRGTNGSARGVYRCWNYAGFLGTRMDEFQNGGENQAVLLSQTGGPVHFDNGCYVSANGEAIIGGGEAQPSYHQASASDITIKHLWVDRPRFWQQDINIAGQCPGTVAVSSAANSIVTGTGTLFLTNADGPITPPQLFLFFIPGVNQAPMGLIGSSTNTNMILAGNYGAFGAGQSYAVIKGSRLDDPVQSAGVTMTVTGTNTVTRSAGTFPATVEVGQYWVRLDSLTGLRYLITAINGGRTALTVSGSPANGAGIANWFVGWWDGYGGTGANGYGTIKDMIDWKIGSRVWMYGIVTSNFWPNAQAYPWKVASQNNDETLDVPDYTFEYSRSYNCPTLWANSVNFGQAGPSLIQHHLCLNVDDPALLGGTGSMSEMGQQLGWTMQHVTCISTNVNASRNAHRLPGGATSLTAYQNSIFPYGLLGFTTPTGDTNDAALAAVGIPLANVDRNVWPGSQAVADLPGFGSLRGKTLAGWMYGNAAVPDQTGVGYINNTGTLAGDYRLMPLYITNAGACTVTGAVVTLNAGAFPAGLVKGMPFRVTTDHVRFFTSILSRDSGTQLTLAIAYPGTQGAGQTGVITFQGTANDSAVTVDPTAAGAATVTNPAAPTVTETYTHADANSLTADNPWTQLDTSNFTLAIRGNQGTILGVGGPVAGFARCDTTLGTPDHESDVLITSFTNALNAQFGPCVRKDGTTAKTYYYLRYVPFTVGGFNFTIGKTVAEVATDLAGVLLPTVTAPFALKLRVSGTTLTAFLNGVQIMTLSDASIATGNDFGVAGYLASASDQVFFKFAHGGAVASLSNPTVTLSSGTFPVYTAGGDTFLVTGDPTIDAVPIATRDSATQLSLGTRYSGAAGAGKTGLVTANLPLGLDPGGDIPAILAATAGVDT